MHASSAQKEVTAWFFASGSSTEITQCALQWRGSSTSLHQCLPALFGLLQSVHYNGRDQQQAYRQDQQGTLVVSVLELASFERGVALVFATVQCLYSLECLGHSSVIWITTHETGVYAERPRYIPCKRPQVGSVVPRARLPSFVTGNAVQRVHSGEQAVHTPNCKLKFVSGKPAPMQNKKPAQPH
jgi:hypothetical protein